MSKSEKKFHTIMYKNIHTGKLETQWFPMLDGEKAPLSAWKALVKNSKQRKETAAIYVSGSGKLIGNTKVSSKSMAVNGMHGSDILLGQFAQSHGLYKSYITSEKAAGFISQKDWTKDMKKIREYKLSYKKRMIAFSKEILVERKNLIKESGSLILN